MRWAPQIGDRKAAGKLWQGTPCLIFTGRRRLTLLRYFAAARP
ncbi:hypothetical protein SUDANB178_03826 [Streptomyces sp. enrichment culture]